jgi:SMODS and SLOG-associating 2TM effector domain 1/Protein of unknown function (DUF4231)
MAAATRTTLQEVWLDSKRCSQLSRDLKADLSTIRKWVLWLTVAGPILGVLSAQLPDLFHRLLPDLVAWWQALPYLTWVRQLGVARTLAFASALALGLGTYLAAKVSEAGVERRWVLARSIAEALKSAAYRYAISAPPYDGPGRDVTLTQAWRDLRVRVMLGEAVALADEAKALSDLPADSLSMDAYVGGRVMGQQRWYASRAAERAEQASELRNWTLALGGLGVTLAAARGVWPEFPAVAAWIGITSAAGAAVTSYLYAWRYISEAQAYETTSLRLTWALDDWQRLGATDRPGRQGEFVNTFEDIMLTENKQWVAEFDKPASPPTNPPPPVVQPKPA